MGYTVPGYQPTPESTPGAKFDNVKIAKATEIAADIYELEQLDARTPGAAPHVTQPSSIYRPIFPMRERLLDSA
ncbi:MAG TPA: hypothetical protein VMP89_14425 [Solirubrobacteraceae bacterium]|nr:hypothetical protein [Solirubrobacteraceae bacterium]